MKKILFINHSNHIHGAETIMLHLMKERKKAGDKIYIVTPREKKRYIKKEIDAIEVEKWILLPYKMLGKNLFRSLFVSFFYNAYALLYLMFFVRKEKIDIIYSNTSINILGASLAFFTRKKHIWHFHESLSKQYNWNNSLKYIYSFFINSRNTIIFIAEEQKKQWTSLIRNINKAYVIYNPIKELEYLPKENKNEIVFGYLGNINQRKNIDALLESFVLLCKKTNKQNLRLKLLGDEKEIEKKINLLSIDPTIKDKISLSGYTNQVSTFYNSIDILMLVSYTELMPLVVLEGLSMKKAVIATSQSFLKELLEDKKDCLFVNPHDVKDIMQKMELLVTDTQLLNDLQENGWNTVRNLQLKESFSQTFSLIFKE